MNPQRNNWTQRGRKTQSTREQTIPKQIPQEIWLDWHTSNRNREASIWRRPGRLSRHFRQTQNGYWVEHEIQCESISERRQSCIGPKPTNVNQLERRPKCWNRFDAQIRNQYSTGVLQVRKFHVSTEEAQRKITSPCGSQENQQSDCGWLY